MLREAARRVNSAGQRRRVGSRAAARTPEKMGWPDSASSSFSLPADGKKPHHLQQKQTHKQSILSFFFFVFGSDFFVLSSPICCFLFFFRSSSLYWRRLLEDLIQSWQAGWPAVKEIGCSCGGLRLLAGLRALLKLGRPGEGLGRG